MRLLSKSASCTAKVTGKARLLEGTLFLGATEAGKEPGTWTWSPFLFAHHHDGTLSLKPLTDAGPAENDEQTLDADWQQPFVAAPWAPIVTDSRLGQDATSKSGSKLYPFSLSYMPLQDDTSAVERRTVMLATRDASARNLWLTSFAQKAQRPDLRALPLFSKAKSQRRPVILGETTGLLPPIMRTFGQSESNGRRRLAPTGPAALWKSKSSLHVVRDLYDGYASDPLRADRGAEDGSTKQREKFLEKYLEKQALIEQLLEEKWLAHSASAPPPSRSPTMSVRLSPVTSYAVDMTFGAPLATMSRSPKATLLRQPGPPGYTIVSQTPNISIDGDIVSNDRWSGGVMFATLEKYSFQLTVCALDPFETHPIFIGIAREAADLATVNFFDSPDALLLCLQPPGQPQLHVCGTRRPVDLPPPSAGCTVSVAVSQALGDDGPARYVSFAIGIDGRSRSFHQKLPAIFAADCFPCLLLCHGGTRLRMS